MTILELFSLLSKTSTRLNNKKVLVDVMINDDSKIIHNCEIMYAIINQDNNMILVCGGDK
ncbi:MAG: hypothetical protein WC319_15030 [Candidatus Paceibacterota bacterium]|jgi:hypothetical protein